jgi:hypothetical protein
MALPFWDVIHFNFGLHDLCHRHPDGNDKERGTVMATPAAYAENLDVIATRLRMIRDDTMARLAPPVRSFVHRPSALVS